MWPPPLASALTAYHRRRRQMAATPDRGGGARPAPEPRPGGENWRPLRIWIFVFVLIGATLVPLALEVVWRSDGTNASSHVQPEVAVVEQAGDRVAQGKNPYQLEERDGHVVSSVPGQPTYESFFPYLPLMTVFGLPASTKGPLRLTDARIFFSLFTLVVTAVALVLCRGPTGPKVRTLQVLTVLPTAALPLATGGDDMVVVALLLLAMVLAQQRRPGWSGIVLGVASSDEVHRLAPGRPRPLRRPRPRRAAVARPHGSRHAGRGCPRRDALHLPQPPRLLGERDPVPPRPGRRGVAGGQPSSGSRPGLGLPPPAPHLPDHRRGGGRGHPLAPLAPPSSAVGRGRVHPDGLGDDRRHPARPRHPHWLRAVPHQLLRVGPPPQRRRRPGGASRRVHGGVEAGG